MVTSNYVKINNEYYAPNTKQAKAYAQSLGGLGNTERKRDALPALEQSKKAHGSRKRFVAPVIEIHIVSFRRKQADLDNIIAGAKPIRDAISKSIGCDDGDSRLRWTYSTVITTGATGTQVLISRL